MRSEEEIRNHKAVLERQLKDYRRIAQKCLTMEALAALLMEHRLVREIGVLEWVLEKR
jgi:hypothetical protein